MPKKNPENSLSSNNNILGTVSIVNENEVVKRNNNEYIYLEALGGVVSQPEEIETVKNRQSIDVLKNQLLGQFNTETGKYEISNNIELELQQIVKVETHSVGNAVYAESLSSFGGLGKLKFVVKTTVKKQEAVSELFVFERVKKMAKMVTNTQMKLIAEFKRSNDNYVNLESLSFENYYRFAWAYFKIVKQNQIFAMSEDEKFLQGWIVRRKLYLNVMDEKLNPSIELAESELLLNRMEVLSELGNYGYKVLARFEEIKNQAVKFVGGNLTARDQNEFLEEAIETFRGQYPVEQELFYKKQFKSVETYTKTISTLKDKNHKQVLSEIEERMPTVVEVIKREDERQQQEAQTAKAVKEAQESAQTKWPTEEKPAQAKPQQQGEQPAQTEKPVADVKPTSQAENKPQENLPKQEVPSSENTPQEPKIEVQPTIIVPPTITSDIKIEDKQTKKTEQKIEDKGEIKQPEVDVEWLNDDSSEIPTQKEIEELKQVVEAVKARAEESSTTVTDKQESGNVELPKVDEKSINKKEFDKKTTEAVIEAKHEIPATASKEGESSLKSEEEFAVDLNASTMNETNETDLNAEFGLLNDESEFNSLNINNSALVK